MTRRTFYWPIGRGCSSGSPQPRGGAAAADPRAGRPVACRDLSAEWVGRVLSVAVHGWPHSFQIPLAVLELALPPVYFWLADADERAAAEAKATADG